MQNLERLAEFLSAQLSCGIGYATAGLRLKARHPYTEERILSAMTILPNRISSIQEIQELINIVDTQIRSENTTIAHIDYFEVELLNIARKDVVSYYPLPQTTENNVEDQQVNKENEFVTSNRARNYIQNPTLVNMHKNGFGEMDGKGGTAPPSPTQLITTQERLQQEKEMEVEDEIPPTLPDVFEEDDVIAKSTQKTGDIVEQESNPDVEQNQQEQQQEDDDEIAHESISIAASPIASVSSFLDKEVESSPMSITGFVDKPPTQISRISLASVDDSGFLDKTQKSRISIGSFSVLNQHTTNTTNTTNTCNNVNGNGNFTINGVNNPDIFTQKSIFTLPQSSPSSSVVVPLTGRTSMDRRSVSKSRSKRRSSLARGNHFSQ